MSYLAHEAEYRALVTAFLAGRIDAAGFVGRFFALWKSDCDAQWKSVHQGMTIDPEEEKLGGVLDRIFTACDCYREPPIAPQDLTAAGLRAEVGSLAAERWRET